MRTELEVRLAYERGLLTGESQSHIQRWGLVYMLTAKRRDSAKSREGLLKGLTLALAPQRFEEMYLRDQGEPGLIGDDQNIGVEDLDAVEQFLRELDSKKSMTAEEDVSERWGEWV